MDSTILFIHADPKLCSDARAALERAGHDVWVGTSAAQLNARVFPVPPDVVVAPWEQFGKVRAYARSLGKRRRRRGIAIVVLADAVDIASAIGCLEHGAEDCIAMPFVQQELVMRIQACLRRHGFNGVASRQLVAGPIVLDEAALSLEIEADRVELAPAELKLLTFFLRNPGRAFTRSQLLDGVRGAGSGVSERTIDVHVRRLRKALEPYGCDGTIQTVRKYGYRFSASPRRKPAKAANQRDTARAKDDSRL